MSLQKLLLNDTTRKQLEALLINPPHAILFGGPAGIGKMAAAKAFAYEINDAADAVQVISPGETGTIAIETIRDLYVQTRGSQTAKKIFIIESAHAMSEPAQNSFLKLLEEPGGQVIFLLTANNYSALLPTIHSRMQQVELKPISQQQSADILKNAGITDQSLQMQLLFIAKGLPGELTALATDDEYRQLRLTQAASAKKLIAGSRYDQLVAISELAKPGIQRADLLSIVSIAIKMLKAQLARTTDDSILTKIALFILAYEKIRQNGHIRTQLMRTVK